jgi:hypothetical protein
VKKRVMNELSPVLSGNSSNEVVSGSVPVAVSLAQCTAGFHSRS